MFQNIVTRTVVLKSMGGEVVEVGVLRERLVKELVFKSYYMLGQLWLQQMWAEAIANLGR